MALRPCTFYEFLGAINEKGLQNMLDEGSVPEPLHERMLSLFNKYSLVGGTVDGGKYVVRQFILQFVKNFIALFTQFPTFTPEFLRSFTS